MTEPTAFAWRRVIAVLALLAPGAALAQSDGIAATARPAYDAIHTRCPELRLAACCEEPNDVVGGALRGDRATLVRDCSWVGNGGEGDARETVVVDLASCHAACSVEEYAGGDPVGVFDAFAMTDPPAPPPDPPGVPFRPDDPRTSVAALLLTADRIPPVTEVSGLALRALAALPEQPGPPGATPAAHLTAADLRALGITPRPRPRPDASGRVLRGYRLTRALGAPRETRVQGEHALYETDGARCVAIAHRAAGTHQWVRCFPSAGRITWIGGDDAIVIGQFAGEMGNWDVPSRDEQGRMLWPRSTFAIEIGTGRSHTLDVAQAGRCEGATRARVSGPTLTLRRCRASVTITLADLARTLAAR